MHLPTADKLNLVPLFLTTYSQRRLVECPCWIKLTSSFPNPNCFAVDVGFLFHWLSPLFSFVSHLFTAIFPSKSSLDPSVLKPARPAFSPNVNHVQTTIDYDLKPVKPPGLVKLSSCDKSYPTGELALSTGYGSGKSETKPFSGSKIEANGRLFCTHPSENRSAKNSLSAAANVDFRHELERRLQQQHQTQGNSYDRPSASLKLNKPSKPSFAEPKSYQGSSPTNTITCGFLTIPRKKSVQPSSVTQITTTVDRPVLRANPQNPLSPSTSPQTSSSAFCVLPVGQTHLRPIKGSSVQQQQQQQPQLQTQHQQPSTGIPRPALRSPKRSAPPWFNPQTANSSVSRGAANPCSLKPNEQSSKRLSWTGPDRLHRPSDAPAMRIQRFCLPTILSNSSTGLDSVEVTSQNQPPSSQVLIDRLMELVQRLEKLRTDDPEPEQVIACAEQLEVSRLDCSAFIDQANCSARAKFAFRDRYAPLQQLSASLRSNRSKQSPNPNKLISAAVAALQDILTALSKLSDDESNTSGAVDDHEVEAEDEQVRSIDGLHNPVSRPLHFAAVPTKLPQRVLE